jgi:ubiquinone/menaquinone biosynthesis C-methylase UbiE
MRGSRFDIPSWWPTETADPHPYLASDEISQYDQKAGYDPRSDIELLQSLGLDPQDTVIDFGAGTGTFATAAAAHCGTVIAVDISPAMTEVVQQRTRALGINNIVSVCAGLLSYRHEGDAPAFLFSRNTLHHLSDFWKVLSLTHMYQLLKPGGVLRLRDLAFHFSPIETVPAVERWFANATTDSAQGWTRAELEHEVKTEYFTYTWLLEAMLERVGFVIEKREYSPSGIFAAYVCRKQEAE